MRMTEAHKEVLRELGLPDSQEGIDAMVSKMTDDEAIALEERLADEAVLRNRRDASSLTERGELIIDLISMLPDA